MNVEVKRSVIYESIDSSIDSINLNVKIPPSSGLLLAVFLFQDRAYVVECPKAPPLAPYQGASSVIHHLV